MINANECVTVENTMIHARNVRSDRDVALSRCDWTQMLDVSLDTDAQLAWKEYRQKLRDLPLQEGFPWVIEWPTKPL